MSGLPTVISDQPPLPAAPLAAVAAPNEPALTGVLGPEPDPVYASLIRPFSTLPPPPPGGNWVFTP